MKKLCLILQDAHTYTISDGTNTYSVKASALTFANIALSRGDEKLATVGKVLYLYNLRATQTFKRQ